MVAYAIGNIGGRIFIVGVVWKLKRSDSQHKNPSLLVAGVVAIIAFGIAGYVGIGNYIMEFIAG